MNGESLEHPLHVLQHGLHLCQSAGDDMEQQRNVDPEGLHGAERGYPLGRMNCLLIMGADHGIGHQFYCAVTHQLFWACVGGQARGHCWSNPPKGVRFFEAWVVCVCSGCHIGCACEAKHQL